MKCGPLALFVAICLPQDSATNKLTVCNPKHSPMLAQTLQTCMLMQRTPASRRKESLAASMDVARGPGGKEKSKSMSNDEIIEQLGRGKKKSENMTAAIRDSLRQMTAMMDDHDAEKEPVANLRDSMPAQLEKLNEAWLQTDDLGAVRQAMDEEADAQNVARYEDEYSVISRCRFKYNPVHELRRYIPAVGVRALLTNRGVAVEILGDPMNIEDAKLWKRRIRIISSQASCGPMDRPSRNRQIVASSFSHPSPAVSGFFNRRKTMAVRACVVHAV